MEQKNIEAFLGTRKPARKKRSGSPKGKESGSKDSGAEKHDLAHFEGVLKMYREIGHQEGVVDTLIEIALLHAGKNSLLNGIDAAERAHKAAINLQDSREPTTLLLLGDLRSITRDATSAVTNWSEVIDHSEAEDAQIIGACLRLVQHELKTGSGGSSTHPSQRSSPGSSSFLRYIEQAEAVAPTSHAAILRSTDSRQSNDLHSAAEWVEKAIARIGNHPEPTVFLQIPVLPPAGDSDLHRAKGEIQHQQGRLRESAASFELAGDYLSQGDVLRELGNMELALAAYRVGMKRTSLGVFVLRTAELMIEMGNEQEAITLLDKSEKGLMKKEPSLAIEALDLRLVIINGQKDQAEKARLYERRAEIFETLEEFQGMTESLLKAVEIYQSLPDDESWKRSVKAIQKVIASESKRGRIKEELHLRNRLEALHIERGKPVMKLYQENVDYCYSLMKPQLAIAFFRGEIELHKGRESEFLDYLHLARSFLSAGKRTEALATYQEAVKRYSEPGVRGTILRETGYVHRVTGNMEKAQKVLTSAISNFKRAKNREGQVRAICELEKLYDDEIAREKMVRSSHISAMNKIRNSMESLTEENNASQKIIRETTKVIEGMEAEATEKRNHLEQMRTELPENGSGRKKQLGMMEKLRNSITKLEESTENLHRTVREHQSKKIQGQETRAELKEQFLEMQKKDAGMKRKIEAIEATGADYREQAMKMDPMLATSAKLETIEEDIYHSLSAGNIPQIRIPTRTKDNIEFSDSQHVFRYGSGLSFRSAKSTDGANMLMRTAYVINFIDDMIQTSLKGKNRSSTLRELYYISESWGKLAKFGTQNESNNLIEDLEIITRYLRENFHLRPEEDGARVIGNITLREKNRKGEWKNINCRNDVGDSGYTIPYNAEKEKLTFKEVDADFVIAIETGGMFDRLVENGFDEDARAVLVHIKGQPARSTRRFLKRMNEETRLPILVFTDGDPWSYRIFASIAYGAIKTAHISHHLATPSAEYVGITPSDILTYDLPTDKLSPKDIEALNSELTDPRFTDAFWQEEISTQLKINKKSEQQALAKYGLDFVTDTYLPEKLGEMGYMR
jgi:DNA topoisomerase VI subunit A